MCDLLVNKLNHMQPLWISWQKPNVKKKKIYISKSRKTHTSYPRIPVQFLIDMYVQLSIHDNDKMKTS